MQHPSVRCRAHNPGSVRHVFTFMHCSHTATPMQPQQLHCNHTATTLQHGETFCNTQKMRDVYQHACTATHCNHTAEHCNTLKRNITNRKCETHIDIHAPHCNHTATTLQPHCNHTATTLQPHCNELQHTGSARHVSTCMHTLTATHRTPCLHSHLCNRAT